MINGVNMSYKSQSDLYLEDNISKYPAIELLCKLGYQYISPDECVAQRGGLYDVILKYLLHSIGHSGRASFWLKQSGISFVRCGLPYRQNARVQQ